MNENLCRALLRARLGEADVAAQLQVDPKTVRRWLEGRVPYLRHRWALAGLLGTDEEDLWPQLRAPRSMPYEVQAIYAHLDAVPSGMWLRLFGSAEREVEILAGYGDTVLQDAKVQAVLARVAGAGVPVRICLMGHPEAPESTGERTPRVVQEGAAATEHGLSDALRAAGSVQVRGRVGVLYAALYRADDELLISQRAYGVPKAQAPVLHVRGDAGGPLASAHLDCFERIWAGSCALG